jgi:hypothetical protein
MSCIGSKEFDEAVTALMRLDSLELCIEALHQSILRKRDAIIEQNEADARAAGYSNPISMQMEEAGEQYPDIVYGGTSSARINDDPMPF